MSGKVKSYRDLLIWQKSIEMVKKIYELVRKFPKEETYLLGDQLKRAAISIPSNIAEGQGQARQHTPEFKQFLYISLGSLAELNTQLIIAKELGYINHNTPWFGRGLHGRARLGTPARSARIESRMK